MTNEHHGSQSPEHDDRQEESIEIPLERVNPETLRRMLEEFVTREWSELADSGYTLDEKVAQVLQQLKSKRARIVFDCTSETWNIVPNG
jgi:uncharacterized protein YheU (UPF0270 family)